MDEADGRSEFRAGSPGTRGASEYSSSLCDFTLTDADLFPPALKESQRGEKHSVVPRYLIWAENTSGNEVAGDVRQ